MSMYTMSHPPERGTMMLELQKCVVEIFWPEEPLMQIHFHADYYNEAPSLSRGENEIFFLQAISGHSTSVISLNSSSSVKASLGDSEQG